MNKTVSFPLKISNQKIMRSYRLVNAEIARDLLRIGFAMFEAEKKIKDDIEFNKLLIKISLTSFSHIQNTDLEKDLEDLFKEVLDKEIKVEIVCSSDLKFKKTKTKISPTKISNLVLFSGGVDSFIGLTEVCNKYKDNSAVFVAHEDQAGVINIVNNISLTILKKLDIRMNTVYAPSIRPKKNKQGYSQLRGFLYILYVASFSELVKSDKIFITECGATMYQPKFGRYDSITHTTHPAVLKTAKKVINLIRGKSVSLITPFENMTKSEIISFSSFNKYLEKTHSCISARFRNHCGICYGCVLRRLGAILADVKDCNYVNDILGADNVEDDNLISLIRFSYYFLNDRKRIPKYSLKKITQFNKEDLFERQSLDILATIYLIYKQKAKMSIRLKRAFDIYVKKISEEKLIKRIHTIRNNKIKPDYSKEVN